MNHACLVYDGRLVIDAKFHTNDVSIRAAGPLTKFQRRYYTKLRHADFNSKEIGIQVNVIVRFMMLCGICLHGNGDKMSTSLSIIDLYCAES